MDIGFTWDEEKYQKVVDGHHITFHYSEEDLPLYRLITAFDAEGRWLDEYQRRRV